MKNVLGFLFSILLVLGVFSGYAQTVAISGKVTSSHSGNPIPGVSVVVKGSTLGTITDEDGNFLMNLPENEKTLVFSFIGMKTVEKTVNGKELNVILEPEFIGLEEVIVLGYNEKNKEEITGSVIQIDGEEIEGVPVTSVDQALQGKVPGLNVFTTSGTPGSAHDIRIRGTGSITAGNAPLFVVDGVPVINENFGGDETQSSLTSLAAINSSDIESITVLKDASATSAYGARGANGVIVITTKKGNVGKTKFAASASIGFQNNAVEGFKTLTGQQKSELLQEAVYNSFGVGGNFSKEDAYFFATEVLNISALKNWDGTEYNWNELLQNKNAPVQNYNVSARGGDEISSFYASLGFNNTESTAYGSGFERITAKLNYSRNFSASLRFSTNLSIASIRQNGITEPSLYFRNPHLTKYFMNPWISPYTNDGRTLNTSPETSVFNTLYTIDNDILTNDLTRGLANTSLEWRVTPNVVLKSLLSVDYNLAAFHNYVNPIHGDGVPVGGFTKQSVSRNMNFVSQNSMDYLFNVDNHHVKFKALLEYQENKYNHLSGYGETFTVEGLTYLESAAANYDASSFFNDWKNVSYLGMINYDYSKKYLADFTYRSEGSSKFVPGKRFGNFWAVGAGWNIQNEDFLANNQFVNSLRLKASYGTSGNSSVGINRYQPLLTYDISYSGEGAIYPLQFGNTTLTWEKNRNLNIGLDYALSNSFISGSLSYYHKHTYDLLQDVPISRTTGQEVVLFNAGAVNNSGVEAVLNFEIIRSGDFNISAKANIATVHNEVSSLATDITGNEVNIETSTQKVAVGHPVFGWYMREWAGVNSETGNAQWYLSGKGSNVTENYFDPNIEKVWLGSPIPKYTGGTSIHIDYKGVYVDAGLYFVGGHKVYEDFSLFTQSSGIYALQVFNGSMGLLDRWQQPGDVTDVPKLIYGLNNDSEISSRFLYHGDYVRLKNIVLGYNIPKNISDSLGFEGIAISVRGTNLFTWVKDNRLKYDPALSASGFTSFNTPPVKSVVFSINLKF